MRARRSLVVVGALFLLWLAGCGEQDEARQRCAPTGGGPHWAEEGQPVRVTLSCRTGLTLPGSAFQPDPLPAGARYDADTATLTWTPRLDQAGVYLLRIAVPQVGETGEVKIGVADKFDDPANDPTVDPARYTEEYGLPVFHLQADPAINRDTYAPATITYRGKTWTAEAKYRGASSFRYPKKNFTFKFPKADKFDDPERGFRGKRKICLITTFDDTSHVRVRMSFETWNRMDPMNIQVRHASVILFLNGRYHGLYTVSDKIDGNLMQAHGLVEDGDLFMGINHDANFAAWRYDENNPQNESRAKTDLGTGYEKEAGLPEQGMPGAFASIASLVEFVARSDEATFAAEVSKRLDMRDHFNWLVHGTLIQAWDTLGKNSLHYHHPMANGGRWRVALWDFNESFGQTWQARRFPESIDPNEIILRPMGGVGYTNRNWLWRRLWNHPRFGPEVRKRYAEVLRGPLRTADVLAWFDAFVKEVEPSAARDERKWAASARQFYRRGEDLRFADEVAYVRKWIEDRWAFLLARY